MIFLQSGKIGNNGREETERERGEIFNFKTEWNGGDSACCLEIRVIRLGSRSLPF